MNDVSELKRDHIYSDGLRVYRAHRRPRKGKWTWILYRMPIKHGVDLLEILPPGEIFGYVLSRDGEWMEIRTYDRKKVGKEKEESREFPCPHFLSEILPILEEVAPSAKAYYEARLEVKSSKT